MSTEQPLWNLLILDALPPVDNLGALAVGDADGDGHAEMFVAGEGGLLWYRPDTFEKGIIDDGKYHVGLVLEDMDGDGKMEIITERFDPAADRWTIVWFKMGADLGQSWTMHVIDPACEGRAHDIVFADVDGDGARELIGIAAYCENAGVSIYKPGHNPAAHWRKHPVVTGVFAEGTAAADLTGDGKIEIIYGPYWFQQPEGGPYAGPWHQHTYAPSFREMCRAAAADITGNGSPDIVLVESEYMEGRMAWFENRLSDSPESGGWVRHDMERPLLYAHSFAVWKEKAATKIFVAEMAHGGWNPPYNWQARLIQYATEDGGATWQRELIDQGAGTHEAQPFDVDGDGALEIAGKEWARPRVQIWKQSTETPKAARFRHRLLDRDKPITGTDIVAADVDGDGKEDVICAKWWYKNPTWERFEIPQAYQVINAYDVDGDGRAELIATKEAEHAPDNWYGGLSNQLCWLKPVDPINGEWERHDIGTGGGDWPHGNTIAPILPGGGLALIVCYHSVNQGHLHYPEIFEVPDDPTQPWKKRTLAEIAYGEDLKAVDLTRNGELDLVTGEWWLENNGDGTFTPYRFAGDVFDLENMLVPAGDHGGTRASVADVNGNGRLDIIAGEQALDFKKKFAPPSRLVWFEQPEDPRQVPWKMHTIDTLRCPHSLSVADLDGDGQAEIVCGEHDPFWPYRGQCRLYVYKKADPAGSAWYRYMIDDRFEHHDGAKLIELSPGRFGIISHGWQDNIYVHLWEPY